MLLNLFLWGKWQLQLQILEKKNGKLFTQSEKIKEVKASKLKDKEMQKIEKELIK